MCLSLTRPRCRVFLWFVGIAMYLDSIFDKQALKRFARECALGPTALAGELSKLGMQWFRKANGDSGHWFSPF